MKFLCLAVLAIVATATAAPPKRILRVRREEAAEAKPEEADEKFYGRPQVGVALGGAGAGAPVFSHTTLVHHQTNLQGVHAPLPAGGILPVNGLPGGLGGHNAGGFNQAGFNQPLGYQPGSGYGGADVQFANIGPLGRPALSYQAQGINIQLREKEKASEGVQFGGSR